jgi:hypothetical protein
VTGPAAGATAATSEFLGVAPRAIDLAEPQGALRARDAVVRPSVTKVSFDTQTIFRSTLWLWPDEAPEAGRVREKQHAVIVRFCEPASNLLGRRTLGITQRLGQLN